MGTVRTVIATNTTSSKASVNAMTQPSPAWTPARARPSSLANKLNGGRPSRAASPSANVAPSAGRRVSSPRTPAIWVVPVAARTCPDPQNSTALPSP